MPELCHRCHAELPAPPLEPALFCPQCSAPQLRLPEEMLPGAAPPPLAGSPAPPRAGSGLDWRAALPTAAWVAGVGALLSVIGLKLPLVDSLGPVWVLVSGGVVLRAYLRRHPGAAVNARMGWRLGVLAGVLMVGAKGVGVGSAGVVARFVTHSMAGYDVEAAREAQAGEQLGLGMLGTPLRDDKTFVEKYHGLVSSPEVRAGTVLVTAGLQALLIVLFAGLGGGFAGALESRKRLVARR